MIVEIKYCVPCGYLGRAEELQHALLAEFGGRLEAVTLKTGDSGVFELSANGDKLFAKPEEFHLDEVVARVRNLLAHAA